MSHAIATKISQDICACCTTAIVQKEKLKSLNWVAISIVFKWDEPPCNSHVACTTRMSSPVLFCDDKLEMIIIQSGWPLEWQTDFPKFWKLLTRTERQNLRSKRGRALYIRWCLSRVPRVQIPIGVRPSFNCKNEMDYWLPVSPQLRSFSHPRFGRQSHPHYWWMFGTRVRSRTAMCQKECIENHHRILAVTPSWGGSQTSDSQPYEPSWYSRRRLNGPNYQGWWLRFPQIWVI